MSSSGGGGGGNPGSMNNMNKSAAAVGRALLQGNKAPQAQAPQSSNIDGGGDSSAGGLLAQLQAQQPGMFDNNTARSFLSGGSQGGNLGKSQLGLCIWLGCLFGCFIDLVAMEGFHKALSLLQIFATCT